MTPRLGNSFPQDSKQFFCKQNLKLGAVFRLRVPHTRPPKTKRFIVIGINAAINSVGFLFVNSEINPNIFRSSKLKRLHKLLTKKERSYLDSDSYVDCSFIQEWSLNILKNKFLADMNIYLGQVSDKDMLEIKRLVKSAKTIKKSLKKRYGLIT
jgi:hypothetical protein